MEPGADAMAEECRVSRIWLPNSYSFHLAKVPQGKFACIWDDASMCMEIRIHFLSYLLLVLCSPGYVVIILSFIPLNSHLRSLWRRWTDARPCSAAESQVTWSTAANMPLAARKSCLKKLLWASLPGGWPWEKENLVFFFPKCEVAAVPLYLATAEWFCSDSSGLESSCTSHVPEEKGRWTSSF